MELCDTTTQGLKKTMIKNVVRTQEYDKDDATYMKI